MPDQEPKKGLQSGGNPQRTKVRKRGSLPRNQQEEKTARVGTLAVSLLQDKELASQLSGTCATQAGEPHRDKSCRRRNASRGRLPRKGGLHAKTMHRKQERRGTRPRSSAQFIRNG